MNTEIQSWIDQQRNEVLSILKNCGIDQGVTSR
jgi:hypothetical protein